MALKPDLVEFPDLSHRAFQHPLDERATAILRKVRGVDSLMKFVSQKAFEQLLNYENMSSRLLVGPEQYPSIFNQYVRMAKILDVRKRPKLYIETRPDINAVSFGLEDYSIILYSGLIDIMDEDELLAVLAHELGHVKCEHQLYITMAWVLSTFGDQLISQLGSLDIPGLGFLLSTASFGVKLGLIDWNRKAKFSCDRAALLATQNPDKVASCLAKLAGFSSKYAEELNLDDVEKQAEHYQEIATDSKLVRLFALQSMMDATHPCPVLRVKEIRRWSKSEEYRQILDGKYKTLKPLSSSAGWEHVVIGTPRARECPNQRCKFPNDEDFLFCLVCGTNVRSGQLLCSQSRDAVQDDWNLCMQCGARLVPEMLDLPEIGN